MTFQCNPADTGTMPEHKPTDTILATMHVYADAEMHLRLRELPDSPIPPFLDFAVYNLQGGGYTTAFEFPQDPELIRWMIQSLQARLDQL